MEKIKVVCKRHDSKPYVTWVSNNLKNFQNFVGGYIEVVPICEDLVVVCNEEGRLMNLPANCNISGIDFVGDIMFCGVKDDEFCDIPCDFQNFKLVFSSLWKEAV